VKGKVFPKPRSSKDSTELHFDNGQPDTSLYCKTTNTALVHLVMCLLK